MNTTAADARNFIDRAAQNETELTVIGEVLDKAEVGRTISSTGADARTLTTVERVEVMADALEKMGKVSVKDGERLGKVRRQLAASESHVRTISESLDLFRICYTELFPQMLKDAGAPLPPLNPATIMTPAQMIDALTKRWGEVLAENKAASERVEQKDRGIANLQSRLDAMEGVERLLTYDVRDVLVKLGMPDDQDISHTDAIERLIGNAERLDAEVRLHRDGRLAPANRGTTTKVTATELQYVHDHEQRVAAHTKALDELLSWLAKEAGNMDPKIDALLANVNAGRSWFKSLPIKPPPTMSIDRKKAPGTLTEAQQAKDDLSTTLMTNTLAAHAIDVLIQARIAETVR